MRQKTHETWYRGFKFTEEEIQKTAWLSPHKEDCASKNITADLKWKDMHFIIFVPLIKINPEPNASPAQYFNIADKTNNAASKI